jgi:hypothetical protein
MSLENVVREIDDEIIRLQEARKLLSGSTAVHLPTALRAGAIKPGGKRNLSPAARKRIADAQKRRWAKHHAAKLKAKAGSTAS